MLRVFWLLLVVVFVGCSSMHPDGASGEDAFRHQATLLQLDQSEGDSVSVVDGDATDWKVIETTDVGLLRVEVILDNPDASVEVALFDRYGKMISRISHRKGDGPLVTLAADVGLGKYFIKIQAEGSKTKTGYTIKATMN